jgi:hypothetical protein
MYNITFSMMIRIQHSYGGRSIIFFLLICVLLAHLTLMDQWTPMPFLIDYVWNCCIEALANIELHAKVWIIVKVLYLFIYFFLSFWTCFLVVQWLNIALSNGCFLAHWTSFRQFIYLDLGSRCSLTAMIIHIRWSGTCGLFIGWCWLQSMASYCSCTIPSGEKDYLVSLSGICKLKLSRINFIAV